MVRVHFRGPARYGIRSAVRLCKSILETSARRTLSGPRQAGWNWFMELASEALKTQMATAFKTRDVAEMRRYLDSVEVVLPRSSVNITPVAHEKLRGHWFVPKNTEQRITLLYFHGGGYSFYPRSYHYFISLITIAAQARTFALDYRLAPEHRFPAQLEDALSAYQWLLNSGIAPEALVIGGDSAGGNLALALVLAARDQRLPLPSLIVALSPAVGFEDSSRSRIAKQPTDWIDPEMFLRWADWFCDASQRQNPLVSPVLADLRGLPPIYIQAGRAEVLYDSIQLLADRANSVRVDLTLEVWDHMNHVFQMFGPGVPQSAAALRRLGEVISSRTWLRYGLRPT